MSNTSSAKFLAMGLKSLVDAGGAWIKESIDETFNDDDEKTASPDTKVLSDQSDSTTSKE